MSERREAGFPPNSERGLPARRQETQAEPTEGEAKPESTRRGSRQEAKS